MEPTPYQFIDRSGLSEPPLNLTTPVVVRKEALEAEVQRLASLPAPANGRRISIIANPATGVGNGLAHGTAVVLCVLKPGERTRPIRQNSSQVNFCIQGRGYSVIAGKRITFNQYDVWNTPSWAAYQHANDSNEVQVRLTYSNSALLENIHIVDENPPENEDHRDSRHEAPKSTNPFGAFQLTGDGAFLMPYEQLINPEIIPSEPRRTA